MRSRARYFLPLILTLAIVVAIGLGWWSMRPGRLPGAPSPLPAGVAVKLTGYHEATFDEEGFLIPVVSSGGEIDICLRTPARVDTSQWQARLYTDRPPADGKGYQEPVHRLETTLCFRHRLSAELPSEAKLELCGEVLDRFDERGFRLPCQRLHYRADESDRQEVLTAMDAVLRSLPDRGLDEVLRELDGVAARARVAEFPFLALQIDLIAVYYLRRERTSKALASARQRLEGLPDWLDQPTALSWAAPVAYERALVELDDGWRLKAAWEHLSLADRLCHQVLHPMRFTVRMKQAEILARVGAVGDAIRRLSTALADCETTPCYAGLEPSAHGVLAWLIILDPQATDEDLTRAAASLEIALQGARSTEDVFEKANQLINRGYLEWRRGDDPRLSLIEARGLLDDASITDADAQRLNGWARLVAGLAALDAEDGDLAQASCAAARQHGQTRLAAWASSCLGQARRRQGDLEGARQAFQEALLHYEYATPGDLGQTFSLTPGGRADAFYRAARLSAEVGDAGEAWEILARLDSLTVNEALLQTCRAPNPTSAEEAELLRDLITLDSPAAGRRKLQRESVRRALRERLRDLLRRRPGCAEALRRWPDGPLQFRAVAVADEILLLRREPGGEVVIDKRNSMPRRQRQRLLGELAATLNDRRTADAAWRELMAPIARALVPSKPERLQPVTVFALHGELQSVPLAALPLPDGRRWLADATTVALRPSGVALARASSSTSAESLPLFVVDPRHDLPSGKVLSEIYRDLFPHARVLVGDDASLANLRRDLPTASWLHVDAHATYDPAFPELSSLLLADHPITLSELAALPVPLRFANLSGCGTGSWPITADSGRYGIAGLLSRLGVRWVVASRSDLPDRLASDFNHAFYRALKRVPQVPAAYERALAAVRERYPAAAWAALLLLSGGGQSEAHATPLEDRRSHAENLGAAGAARTVEERSAEVENEA